MRMTHAPLLADTASGGVAVEFTAQLCLRDDDDDGGGGGAVIHVGGE
jgi:hypothetical protein